ncbi:MAG: DUF427 domain-containing protein [Acidimicrobiales bacterium]|nr:DUF427 domain-containing protein [Acidimicrobiales bacterium]RZV48043.1 MAG: DUF427 domain-containing protein [Acidimicrobiales bacterium]
MATATFNGRVIAESDDTTFVEGNHYFPLDSLDRSVTTETDRHTSCPWKGVASYLTIEVDGAVAENAAWFYPEPKDGAEQVANRVAFYPAVTVTD